MNEETDYRGFWRAAVVSCVLCIILFWLPAIIISAYYYLEAHR